MASDEPGTAQPAEPETLDLSVGTRAELIHREDGWILEIDGIRQSHITPAGDVPALAVTRWLLAALGHRRGRIAHLGGGLMTMPRAIADRAPDAEQLVVELDPVLVELVRERFTVPANVVLEVADAREWLDAGGSGAWGTGACDAVVIDVFVGGRIPPAFTSQECFASAHALLAENGLLLVNSVAGGDLTFTRRQVATMRAEFEHVAVIVQNSSLHGLRFGNAVLIGSDAPIEVDGTRAALAGDPARGALVTDLDRIIGTGEPVADAEGLWSPVPDLPETAAALRLLEQTGSLGPAIRDALPD